MQNPLLSAAVERSFAWQPAPAAPETPDLYNAVAVRRFRLAGTARPAAVLLLNPGFTGGLNVFDYLAEEVVCACGGRVEVWTTERRNNRLEDPSGMERAEAAGDPRMALAQYFPGALATADRGSSGTVRGREEAGPAPTAANGASEALPRVWAQDQVAFVRHWGLAVALADLRAVVQRARAAVGRGKLFLGGHSLGGMLAQCYAAWAFPEGPGHREIDGLVLIDGAVGGLEWTRTTGLAQYAADMQAIESGEYYWDDPIKGATPRFGILGQIAAMAALLPAWRNRPSLVAPRVPELLPLPPGVTVTNEAALGLAIDAESSPISHFRAHVGRLAAETPNAPFQTPAGVPPTGCRLPPTIPLPWLGFRETGELTDLHRIANALGQYDGANGIEWYSSRLLNAEVDLSSSLDSRDADTAVLAERHGLRLRHHGEEGIPVFGVATGSSGQRRERYRWYAATVATRDVTILDAPEQEHLDPLFAENDGRNRSLPALIEWLLARLPAGE